MKKNISTRYFSSIALLLLCSIAIMGFILLYLSVGYFRDSNNKTLFNTVDNVISVLDQVSLAEDADYQEQLKNLGIEVAARVSGSTIFVANSSGTVVLCGAVEPEKYLSRPLPTDAVESIDTTGTYSELGNFGGFFDVRYYVAGKPLILDGSTVGYVFAASSAQALTEFISNLFSLFVMSAGLVLMVSSACAILLTARMTVPLQHLAEAADRMGKGDFSVRVKIDGDDELAQVAKAFNHMAANVERLDSSRHTFVGNIAHELRTPMTSIRGFIDGMLDGTIPPESRDHYLEIVSQEINRLTRLIQNMLDITKLEAGEYEVHTSYYDIWNSLANVIVSDEQRIDANQIQVTGFAPTKVIVYADEDLVYQVLYNLIDNAIKFCNPGGEIHLSVEQSQDTAIISIRNTGDGIAPDVLPFVFDRFYKGDPSRGLHSGGSGLGLHISQVLVRLMGGKIWAESEQGSWCEFSFTLPTRAPKADKH